MEKKKRRRFMQRVSAIVLALCMAVGIVPFTGTVEVKAAGISLADLQAKFPDGKYWNHKTDASHSTSANGFYHYGNCNNPDGWTDSPCSTHQSNVLGGGYYDCNNYGNAIQCCGFVKKLSDDAYGSICTNWGTTSINYAKAGDVIYFSDLGHWAMIIGRSGTTVTVGECNYDYHCRIRWGGSYDVARHSYTIYSAPWELPATSVPHGSYMETGYSQAISNGDYHIVSALEGTLLNPGSKCLTISGLPDAKDDNCASAQLWPVLGLKDHVFTVTWLGNGFYKIKLKDSDNKCLDVSGGDTARGTNVQQWEDNGTASQQWAINDADGGFGYTIQARCSGYYLDVEGGYTNDGTNIQLWEGNGSYAQKWYFVPWGGGGSASQEMPDGEYEIVPKADNSKAINAAGTNIELNTRREDGKHIFQVTWLGNGYYKIIDKNTGLSLDVADGKSIRQTNVQLCKYSDGNNAQQWIIKCCDGGFYYNIISKLNGAYVDLANNNTAEGTNIQMYIANGTSAQKWRFIPWGESIGQTIEDGEYRIVPQSDDSKTLSTAGNGTTSGTNIELNSAQDSEKQVFDIAYAGGGYYSLTDRNSGLPLRAVGNEYGSKVQLGESGTDCQQQWMIKPCGDGSYNVISNYNGLYLDWGKITDEANVWLWFGNDGNLQKWKFVPFIRSVEVESIRLDKNALTVLVGTQSSLEASVSPETATDKTLTWESSNPSVADVDDSGIVTAKSAGTATITVKSANGKTASCQITVEEEKVPEEHIHAYTSAWKSDAESHWKECECGEKSENIAHKFAWVIDKAATKDNEGIKHEECGTCGYKRNIGTVIEKLLPTHTHDYGMSAWKVDAESHWKECECGEKSEEARHRFAWVIDTAATKESEGIKHEECETCGYKRNIGTVIEKLSVDHTHDYEVSAWKSDAETHWKECECGEKSENAVHQFAWVIDRAATEDSTGLKHEECEICGYERSMGTVIEKLNAVCAHAYKTIITPATTQANGSIVETCSKCGEEKSKTVIYAVSNIALSKPSYTYNGKTQKPSITVKDSRGRALKSNTDYTVSYPNGMKNVGGYTVTVTLKGNYSGTISKTFDIVPKGTSISKVTAKKKGFTIKWKKQKKQATGYEIAYSTSSKFVKKLTKIKNAGKSGATSKTVSKLKAKKKYFVRIRTYKTVKINGKSVKLYSNWSKAKAVITKK